MIGCLLIIIFYVLVVSFLFVLHPLLGWAGIVWVAYELYIMFGGDL